MAEDCYPVCFVRALEACGVTQEGGRWVEEMFHRTKRFGSQFWLLAALQGGL